MRYFPMADKIDSHGCWMVSISIPCTQMASELKGKRGAASTVYCSKTCVLPIWIYTKYYDKVPFAKVRGLLHNKGALVTIIILKTCIKLIANGFCTDTKINIPIPKKIFAQRHNSMVTAIKPPWDRCG